MELEDAILSTLKEIENKSKSNLIKTKETFEVKEKKVIKPQKLKNSKASSSDEEQFLNSTRERMLVLFEGFQAPNNTNIEAKIDLTLNYLEYALASIDSRLEKIKGRK